MLQNNWPEYVNKHWEQWRSANPTVKTVDESQLKKILTEDLTYASQMDVKEYTLFQKWCEIQEKYPTKDDGLFGGVTLENSEQELIINQVKSNIWIPQSPDDYEKLVPTMIFTDDTEEIERLLIDGTKVKEKTKRSEDRKSTRLNSSHIPLSRMPSSA